MTTILDKQQTFARFVGLLIEHAYEKGYRLTFGDSYRDPSYHPLAFIKHADGRPPVLSCHGRRLAVDLNLFVDGEWITVDHPAWQELGRFWKGLGSDCAWGGDFSTMDLNHFSIRDGGVA